MTENEGASGGEIFRYSRGDEVRIYNLHVVAGGTELWRVTVRPGHPDHAIKEEDFKSAEVAAQTAQRFVSRAMLCQPGRRICSIGA